MGFRLNHRLGLFAGLLALTGTTVVAGMAYGVASQALTDGLRTQALDASSQLAVRVGGELKHLVDRGNFYISTSQRQDFEKDSELLAVSVLRLNSGEHASADDWYAETRWTLPTDNPAYLSASAVATMDLKYPPDTDRIAMGQSDVFFARSGSMSTLRIAVPYGEKTRNSYTQALVIDAKLGKLRALFAHREGLFAFMTSARGQLVIASDSGHFEVGEDLSQLTLRNEARNARAPRGSLDYRETPQGGLQHAAYARVVSAPWAASGLTVFAQAPQTVVTTSLQPLALGLSAAGLAFVVLLGLSIGWIGPRWAWAEGLVGMDGKKTPADTISVTAALVKTQNPQNSRIIKPLGKRMQAAVLHAQLHGVGRLATDTDSENLFQLLNEFRQKAMHAIESRQGTVDHMRGGSIVGLWGVLESNAEDVQHAIQAAQEIRAAADHLASALDARGQSPSRLAMGLHHGTLIMDPVETTDTGRFEPSAMGEGIEIAARIQEFAEQFGTDFLMTGKAASRAGEDFPTERLTPGDESTPALYELAKEREESEAPITNAA